MATIKGVVCYAPGDIRVEQVARPVQAAVVPGTPFTGRLTNEGSSSTNKYRRPNPQSSIL